MKFTIQSLASGAVFVALATNALAAEKVAPPSNEKARHAITVLQSAAPPAEKAMACKQLAVYGTPAAVPTLAPLLADTELSSWARIALEAIPGKASDEALRDAMKQLQGPLLVGVINSIGVRRDARAVGVLTAKLNDPDAEVAAAAAIALGRIGGDSAAKALQRALARSSIATRSAVASGCILCAEQFLAAKKFSKAAKLYDEVQQANASQQRTLEATRGLILARQSKGLPLLVETLYSMDQPTFEMGLHTARELPGSTVTETLATELSNLPPDRQGALLLALADRNDMAALPAILNTARSGAKELRLSAFSLLSRRGSQAGVPVLFESLTETDAEIAAGAKATLAEWQGNEVDAELCARLPQARGNARRLLVELAGQRHITAAVPELTKAARDTDPTIHAAGIKALGETVTTSDLGVLTELLAQANTDAAADTAQAALESACERSPDKAACAKILLASFPASPTRAKCSLLRVFGVIANPSALAAVQSALASSESAVQDTAVRVLADWSEPPALQPLFEVFCTTTNESHRFLALRGCVRLLEGDGQSAEQKLQMFGELLARTQRSDDRKAILSGLANVPNPAALKLVEPLLIEPDVQTEAELAYVTIAAATVKSAPTEAKAAATKLQAESKNDTVRDRAAKILGQAK